MVLKKVFVFIAELSIPNTTHTLGNMYESLHYLRHSCMHLYTNAK